MNNSCVFIFGASRSGTTLLLNLFRAFQGVRVIPWESPIDVLSGTGSRVVAKRTRTSALTLVEDLARFPHVLVVSIVRDPREVVTSRFFSSYEFHTDFDRWRRDQSVVEAIESRYQSRCIVIRYEQLVNYPDLSQERIAEFSGLVPERSFSEFPWADTDPDERELRAMGSLRPVMPGGSARWLADAALRRRLLNQVLLYPEIVDHVRLGGFADSDSWVAELNSTMCNPETG